MTMRRGKPTTPAPTPAPSAPTPAPSAPAEAPGEEKPTNRFIAPAAPGGWRKILEGVVGLDVDATAEEVQRAIGDLGEVVTPANVARDLGRVAAVYVEANRLAARARRDYEVMKEEHEAWLEGKRTAARVALEKEKAEGGLKKAITDVMVTDTVRASWPDEYAEAVGRVRSFQAAVHVLEALPDAVRMRASALEAQAKILLATGAIAGREGR